MKLAIVGNSGGTHIGESLRRVGVRDGHAVNFFDAKFASSASRVLNFLTWRLANRRPFFLQRFSSEVVQKCRDERPDILITTGNAPLSRASLDVLRSMGILCINYSTDDPFNPRQRARWHLRALPAYNLVFTARRANIDDLRRLGCADVRWLPFGYDDALFQPTANVGCEKSHDVLFVGGADRDRVEFMTEFLKFGFATALVGDYWASYRTTRACALGIKSPEEICCLTAAAKINLCLVRRANRDGNVMRTFEIAAVGGCMLVEDTLEHRAIFGEDNRAVLYFNSPEQAASRARFLLANPQERSRLKASVQSQITSGGHTYRARLGTMLRAATAQGLGEHRAI
jgi:spore maturation protein CgeB